jgi:hypothetical protein
MEDRKYIGVLAETLYASNGVLTIKNLKEAEESEDPLQAEVSVEGSVDIHENLYVDSRLGVGTDAPVTSAQIAKGTAADLTPETGWAVIGNTDSTNLVFDDQQLMARDDGTPAALKLQSEGGELSVHAGDEESAIIINDEGNVGIGTLSPDSKLHISGDSGVGLDAGSGLLELGLPEALNLLLDNDEIIARNNGSTSALNLQADGGDLNIHARKRGTEFVVKESGNVGVGTTTPNALLHVHGDTDASLDSGTGMVVIGKLNDRNLVMDDNKIMARNDGVKATLFLQANGGGLNVHHHESGTEFVVKDSGKVGVGTVDPDTLLHVNGNHDADLSDGSGLLVVGRINGDNLVLDNNKIIARNNGSRSPLYLQAEGGDLRVHEHREGTEFVVLDSGQVGIGTDNPDTKLWVKGEKSGANNIVTNHVALIENVSTQDKTGVLALRVGKSNPDNYDNFLTFFANDSPIGAVESNTDGDGIKLETTGYDFAESLTMRSVDERIGPGDVVGIYSGKVSLDTDQSHQAMVVSTSPAVVGNSALGAETEPTVPVAFVGQAPTRIRGKVQAGDVVVPSGLNDGTAMAVSPAQLRFDQIAGIIGRAWESSDDEEVKLINVAVGTTSGFQSIQQDEVVSALRSEIEELKRDLAALKKRPEPA